MRMQFFLENNDTRLFEVFSHLVTSNKVIQDDTQLEKLFTLLESSVKDEKSAIVLLSHAEVTNFFVHIEKSEPCEPFQALILGLRLAPHLFTVSCPTPCNTQGDSDVRTHPVPPWVGGVFEAALLTVAWEEGSVRNAWTVGLQTMCHTMSGLSWILSEGYLLKAVDLVYDSSIFVSTQAQTLLVAALPALLTSPSPDSAATKDIIASLQSQMSCSLIGHDTRRMSASLSLVQGLCKVVPPGSSVLRMLHAGMDVLVTSERDDVWGDRAMSSQVISTLLCVLSVKGDDCTTEHAELQHRLEALIQELLRKQHLSAAMKMASQLLVSGHCGCRDVLQEVALLPLTLLLGDQLEHLDTTLMQKTEVTWSQKSAFSQAVIYSINLTSTWSYTERCSVFSVLGRVLHAVLGPAVQRQPVGDGDSRTGWQQAVYNNTRIQRSLLTYFVNLYSGDSLPANSNRLDVMTVKQVFYDCLVLLRRPGLPVTVSLKCFECLAGILNSMEGSADEFLVLAAGGADPMSEFAELLLQGLCDVRWEVRDTAITTLSNIVQHATRGSSVVSWLASHQVGCQLWQSVSDGESYVRAAAVSSLTYLPCHVALWDQVIKVCTKEEVISRLSSILTDDTEAFPRRAVVALLCDWLQAGSLPGHQVAVQAAVNVAIHDLDWEVKLSVVNYWGRVVDKAVQEVKTVVAVPGYAAGLLPPQNNTEYAAGLVPAQNNTEQRFHVTMTRLAEQGCLQCLLSGARDYDQSVQHQACTVLVTLRDTCHKHGLTPPGMGSYGETLAKKPKLCTEISDNTDRTKCNGGCHDGESPSDGGLLTVDRFLIELEELDVTRLLEESSGSIDDYVRNPESLFEDILTSLAKDDEENAIDCY